LSSTVLLGAGLGARLWSPGGDRDTGREGGTQLSHHEHT
jgi:hypothetical protein